ncbi:uncharacterized protein DUF4180 [Paenibacillus taihuensis]|uniref:Uncharacterized protein DUF4180 n=1 Tax=Paenibacillus taihuensis TaxID=1156355 RepID=A0A3D9R167_9BACL|nr:DUF4180 domain-containing protein [Paenibacillus taihuensis]REE68041.1 uncharacterized protein DUF4180 [Paenibacillus taihuensis]
MNITVNQKGSSNVAIIESDEVVIGSVQDALDLMATIQYNHDGCYKLLLHKSAIAESFFDLSTKLAGDILQKFTNYKVNLAIVGDFSGYGSKSLKDFIYESNHGKQFFFLPDEQAALAALHNVR